MLRQLCRFRRRTLAEGREKLLTPELIERYGRLLQKETEQANRERDQGRGQATHDLAQARARIAKVAQRIDEGDEVPKALVTRLEELETAKKRLSGLIVATPAANVVRLPSNYTAIYRQAVPELEQHLVGEGAAKARATRSVR